MWGRGGQIYYCKNKNIPGYHNFLMNYKCKTEVVIFNSKQYAAVYQAVINNHLYMNIALFF